ncbi:MAG: DUF1289 domain-containing protein [Hyphomicrobiales bacterium]|nr:MAG: DUF1289 domain-containing protein [Hyphomicrobiales bacterium]
MQTPCQNICQIDEATRLCLGCGRSLREIGSWTQLSNDERSDIMAQLPARLIQFSELKQ